jgi:diaminopimelate decarboxylase
MTGVDGLKSALERRVAGFVHRRHARRVSALCRLRNGRLDESHWGATVNAHGHLAIGDVDVAALATRFGTPLHVVNVDRLREDCLGFVAAFREFYPNVHLATSYKTNPLPAVLRKLHELGTMAEVISHFELWLALWLGLDPERIILNGPGKSDKALRLAVEKRIGLINFDGLEEIDELERICAELDARDVPVGVRLTTSVGWQSQFGLAIANGFAMQAFRKLADSKHLAPRAVHIHLGTGIANVRAYATAVEEAVSFTRAMENELGIRIDTYDLGGGFGVPTVRFHDRWDACGFESGLAARMSIPQDAPTPREYAEPIVRILSRLAGQAMADGRLRIVFEPGRAITSASQMLLLSVLRRKRLGPEKSILVVDGGKNVTLPLDWEAHTIFPADAMLETSSERYDVFGPLCHPNDVVARNLPLPSSDRGRVLAIMDAGAYFIPNQLSFSNTRPGVVAVENGGVSEIRKPESVEDVVRLDITEAAGTLAVPRRP